MRVMEHNTSDIITHLNIVKEHISLYIDEGTLPLQSMYTLCNASREIADTAPFTQYAINEAATDDKERIDSLLSESHTLKEVAESLVSLYDANASVLESFDARPVIDRLMENHHKSFCEAQELSNVLWKEYTAMSSRLDFMDLQDEEYEPFDRACDAKKSEYDKAASVTRTLGDIESSDRRKYASLYYFDLSLVDVIARRYTHIASCIITDITNARKEDNPCI